MGVLGRKWRRAGVLVASLGGALLLLSALGPTRILNGLGSEAGIDIRRSIAYAPGLRHTLDVYAPAGARNAPLVVFFYGGSWQRGDKATYSFLAKALARRGYVAVVPDYDVYPAVKFPGFLEDGARAVRWARDNAAGFGADADKLFLMGHSAGAHIAAMLAFDGRWLAKEGLDSRRALAGFVGLAGPYDFLPLTDPILKILFGDGDLAQTQPINFVAGGEPPVFLATGRSDASVRPGNSERLAARLRAAGGEVVHQVYPWVGHLTLIGAFAPLVRVLAPVERDVASFIDRVAAARGPVAGH